MPALLHRSALQILALGTILLLLSACSSDSDVSTDTAPFEAAISAYLQQNSMGMKITEFQKIQINGNQATAVCRLQDAEGLYALGVTWTFHIHSSDGERKVRRHVAN